MYMDDFFNENSADGPGVLTFDQLRGLRERCVLDDRALDLWVVIYTHQLDMPVAEQLQLMDVINLWTWHAKDIAELDENLAKLEAVAPGKRLSLGLYLWDYGDRCPMPLESMKVQCEKGLDWLCQGRVESLVLLGSYLCDLGLDTVEWTRNWIADVGGTVIESA